MSDSRPSSSPPVRPPPPSTAAQSPPVRTASRSFRGAVAAGGGAVFAQGEAVARELGFAAEAAVATVTNTVLDSPLLAADDESRRVLVADQYASGEDPSTWAPSSTVKPRRAAVANDIRTDFERRIAQQKSYDRRRDKAISHWPHWRKQLNVFVRNNAYFEGCIFFLLFVNCVVIAMYNTSTDDGYNQGLSIADDVLTVLFFVEMSIKILGRGFIVKPGGYFTTKVNLFDFAIVVITTYGLFQKYAWPQIQKDAAWTVQLATVGRLLRPVRALNAIDSLRSLFQALLVSLRRLADAGLLALTLGLAVGVIAMAAFGDALQFRCVENLFAVDNETRIPIEYPTPPGIHNLDNVSTEIVPDVGLTRVCRYGMPGGVPFNASMPILPPLLEDGLVCPFQEYCMQREAPERGFVNFEFALTTFSTLFSVASLEAWTDVMMYVMEAKGNAAAWYFVIVVLVGTVFVVNLVLAILTDGFTRSFEAIQEHAEQRRLLLDSEASGATGIAAEMAAQIVPGGAMVMISSLAGRSTTTTDSKAEAGGADDAAAAAEGGPQQQEESPSSEEDGDFVDAAMVAMLGKEGAEVMRERATSCIAIVRARCKVVTTSPPFVYFTVAVAFVNTVATGVDESILDDRGIAAMWYIHICCISYFCFEMGLRLLSEPPREFFGNPGNVLDLLVSANSLIELMLVQYSSIGVFRSLNLLYLHPALRRTVTVLSSSLRSTVSNVALLIIATFLFALLGVQLFSGHMCGLDDSSPYRVDTIECDNVPRGNYDNIGYAVVTVFVVFVGNGWREIMTNSMAARSKYAAYFYVAALLVGLYLILSLFVAVLINTVQTNGGLVVHEDSDDVTQDDAEADKKGDPAGDGTSAVEMQSMQQLYQPPLALAASTTEPSTPAKPEPSAADEQPPPSDDHHEDDVDPWSPTAARKQLEHDDEHADRDAHKHPQVLQPEGPPGEWSCADRVRVIWHRRSRIAGTVVRSRAFFAIVVIAIAMSMISLGLESPLSNPYAPAIRFSKIMEIITVVLFVLEAALKLLYMGVFDKSCRGRDLTRYEGGYFNHGWYAFDFLLMLLALASVIAGAIDPRVGNVIAVSRALRPFSLIGRYRSLRIVFMTLTNSIKALGNVSVVAVLIWVLFAVCGTRLYGGLMNACTQGLVWGDASYGPLNIRSEAACHEAGFFWEPFPKNFDNVLESMVTLFGVITKDNWKQVLYMTSSADSFDFAPSANSRPFMVLFGMIYTLVMTFFIINVFLSVLVDSMFRTKKREELKLRRRLREKDSRHADLLCDLNDRQQDFFDLYRRVIFFIKPPAATPYDQSSWRRYVRSVIRSQRFEWALFLLIVLSVILQCFPSPDRQSSWNGVLRGIDLVFNCIFMVSSIAQPIGYGLWEMRAHPFECFMLVLNVVILTGSAIAVGEGPYPSTATTALITLRVVRLTRVAWLTTGVRRIIVTFRSSARSFVGLAFILFLVFYLYAAVGMALFGRVRWGLGIQRYANFTDMSLALLTLFRVATFDNWQALMWDCSVGAPKCDPNLGECGNLVAARIFFMSFVVLSNWIGINCFTAVLLESFSQSEREERFAVREGHVRQFLHLWKHVSGRSMRMRIDRVVDFLCVLPPPLGPLYETYEMKEKHDDAEKRAAMKKKKKEKKASGDDEDDDDGGAGDEALLDSQALAARASTTNFVTVDDDDEASELLERREHVLSVIKDLNLFAVNGTVSRHEVFHALMHYYYAVPLNPTMRQHLEKLVRQAFRSNTVMSGEAMAAAAAAAASPDGSPSGGAVSSEARLGRHLSSMSPMSGAGAASPTADVADMPVISLRTLALIMKLQVKFRRRRLARRIEAKSSMLLGRPSGGAGGGHDAGVRPGGERPVLDIPWAEETDSHHQQQLHSRPGSDDSVADGGDGAASTDHTAAAARFESRKALSITSRDENYTDSLDAVVEE